MKKKKQPVLKRMWKDRYIYLLLVPFMVLLLIFCYGPMYGVLIAFKDYVVKKGVLGSPWADPWYKYFARIFINPDAYKAIFNTLAISLKRMIFCFPMGLIMALIFNEFPGKKVKKAYQTAVTFPHFLSWIIVAALMTNIFSGAGAVNSFLLKLGLEPIPFLANPKFFESLLYLTDIWKGAGWSAIIYLAAIAGIDPTLYEAATIDGATRWKQIIYITLPSVKDTFIILFIMAMGGLMSAGFDQIFNLRNDVVSRSVNIIDTYIHDLTFLQGRPDYSFSTAVGQFKAIANLILLTIANKVSKWVSGTGLFA